MTVANFVSVILVLLVLQIDMCYAPIQIKNNSKLYRPLESKALVTVPCGKCRECIQQKKNDHFVRIYYEWLRTKQSGGQTFFITLTYNDSSLPEIHSLDDKYYSLSLLLNDIYHHRVQWFNDEDYGLWLDKVHRYTTRYNCDLSVPGIDHTSFSSADIKKFFKNLRQLLNTSGKLIYSDLPLKYYLVCEYGDKFGRPHYHALVFVPRSVDSASFITLCRRAWSVQIRKSQYPSFLLPHVQEKPSHDTVKIVSSPNTHWNDYVLTYRSKLGRWQVSHVLGFVNYSSNGAILDNVKGCKYLTEYLNYYDNYLKCDQFERFKDWLKLFPNFRDYKDYDEFCSLYDELKSFFPFRRMSYNFGSLLLEELESKSQKDLVQTLVDNKITITNETMYYRVPAYIVDRLTKDRVDIKGSLTPVTVLSDVGFEVVKSLYNVRVEQKIKFYEECKTVLAPFLTPDDKNEFQRLFHVDVSDYLYLSLDYSKVAEFDIVLNGLLCNHNDIRLDLDSMTAEELIDNCHDIFMSGVHNEPSNILFDDVYELTYLNKHYLQTHSYNNLPQFYYYDKFLATIGFIRKKVLCRDAQEQNEQFTRNTAVRHALHQFRYGT